MRIRQAAATKEHQAVVNAVGRFMKVLMIGLDDNWYFSTILLDILK